MEIRYLTLTLVLTMAIIQSGCSSGHADTNSDGCHVTLSPGNDLIGALDIMDAKEWITLKIPDSAYLRYISKIEVVDGDLYLLDRVTQRCVSRFSSDGLLKKRIGAIGGGPGEYPSILDFTIDKIQRKLMILSDQSMLYIYTLEGEFLKSLKLTDEFIEHISANANGLMATSSYSGFLGTGENYLLYEFDSDLNQTGQWINYDSPMMAPFYPFMQNILTTVDGNSYYTDLLKRRILKYDCKSNDVKPIISFDLKNSMPEEYFLDLMNFMEKQMDYNWIKDCIITKEAILISYVFDCSYSILLMNHQGDVLASGKYSGYSFEGFAGDDGYIYTPVSPDSYLDYWQTVGFNIKPASDVTEDTDFILLKWRIKS